jgi:hypothetical protein
MENLRMRLAEEEDLFDRLGWADISEIVNIGFCPLCNGQLIKGESSSSWYRCEHFDNKGCSFHGFVRSE